MSFFVGVGGIIVGVGVGVAVCSASFCISAGIVFWTESCLLITLTGCANIFFWAEILFCIFLTDCASLTFWAEACADLVASIGLVDSAELDCSTGLVIATSKVRGSVVSYCSVSAGLVT